jgi:GntR family transcriptional regulator
VLRDWFGEAKVKQVYLILRDRILTGAIAFGAKLPTENELAEVHGASRVTIRRALGELACERLIERRRSASTRVIYRGDLAPMIADISGMLASLADMGRRTAVMLTSFAHVPTEAAVAQALGVPSDQMPQRSGRVRSVDGGPFSHLTTYVPEGISPTFTQQELASRALFDLLERAWGQDRAGAPTHQRQVSGARRCRSAQRARFYDQSRRGIVHLHALYRPLGHGRLWSPIATSGRRTRRGSTPCRILNFR